MRVTTTTHVSLDGVTVQTYEPTGRPAYAGAGPRPDA